MSAISENIKKYRKKNSMTQVQLADALGVSESAIYNWETGRRIPRMGYIDKMASLFHIHNTDLMAVDSDQYTNKLDLDIKKNPHLLDMLSYNGQHLDDETKKMYIRLARSQMLDKKDSDKDE